MSQSRVKLGRTVLQLNNTGLKFTVLAVQEPKIFFVFKDFEPPSKK